MRTLKSQVDPKIYQALRTLNRKGLKTDSSCAGVGEIKNHVAGLKLHRNRCHPFTITDTWHRVPSPYILFRENCTESPKMYDLIDLINNNNPPIPRRRFGGLMTAESRLFNVYQMDMLHPNGDRDERWHIRMSKDLLNILNSYVIYGAYKSHPDLFRSLKRFHYRQKIKWLRLMEQFAEDL